MQDIKLNYPVFTIERQLLLPAGSALSAETIEKLISRGRYQTPKTFSVLNYSTVRPDILQLLQNPPYNSIFNDGEVIRESMALMEMVQSALPILHSLDYFKLNDDYTYRHILAVFALSTLLSKDLLPNYISQLQESAISSTHDIGKICVPPYILKKVTPLTRPERDLITSHAGAGYVLLSYYHNDYKHLAARVARDHHEKIDGSGYPHDRGRGW